MQQMNRNAEQLVTAALRNESGPHIMRLQEEALQYAEDWLGSYRKGGSAERLLSAAIPFQQWYRHIIRLTFLTMPYNYPGRSAMLGALAKMGQQYQEEHGVFPDWAQGVLTVGDIIEKTPFGPSLARWGVNTVNLNPFSVISDLAPFTDSPFFASIKISTWLTV